MTDLSLSLHSPLPSYSSFCWSGNCFPDAELTGKATQSECERGRQPCPLWKWSSAPSVLLRAEAKKASGQAGWMDTGIWTECRFLEAWRNEVDGSREILQPDRWGIKHPVNWIFFSPGGIRDKHSWHQILPSQMYCQTIKLLCSRFYCDILKLRLYFIMVQTSKIFLFLKEKLNMFLFKRHLKMSPLLLLISLK